MLHMRAHLVHLSRSPSIRTALLAAFRCVDGTAQNIEYSAVGGTGL